MVPNLAKFGAIDRWSISVLAYRGAPRDDAIGVDLWSALVRIRMFWSTALAATRDAQAPIAPAVREREASVAGVELEADSAR